MGTISDTTQKNDIWKAAETPSRTVAPINVFTLCAVAPTIEPTIAMSDPVIKNLLVPLVYLKHIYAGRLD
jgi:hypothetical protein